MNSMAWFRNFSCLLIAGSLFALAPPSFAEDSDSPPIFSRESKSWVSTSATPIQLGFLPGRGQIFSKDTRVLGLRFSLLSGAQTKVVGIDSGLFNNADSLTGLGLGLCNWTGIDAEGVQLAIGLNNIEANLAGVQIAQFNRIGGLLTGVQLGAVNDVEGGKGLQIGIVNFAESLHGLQLGVMNCNKNGFLRCFPILNYGF
jgi:hypothetical protein